MSVDALDLRPRERQVAALVVKGLSNKETAIELGISPVTVSVHLTRIYSKVGVSSRIGLIRYVCEDQEVTRIYSKVGVSSRIGLIRYVCEDQEDNRQTQAESVMGCCEERNCRDLSPEQEQIADHIGLTGRERKITALVISDLGNAHVALLLGISPVTVGWHLTKIYRKTGVSGRSALTYLICGGLKKKE